MHLEKQAIAPKCRCGSVDNSIMELMTATESAQGCALCGAPARFLAPAGLLCQTDAVFVADDLKYIAEHRLLYLEAGRHRISGAINSIPTSLVS